ncbi:hypothetical protein L195_g045661, partial [Trifolium pratense]
MSGTEIHKTVENTSNSKTSSTTPSTVTVHETSSPPVSIILDGANYQIWSQIMEMHIAGRKKKGYINGRKAAPAESDPKYDDWE